METNSTSRDRASELLAMSVTSTDKRASLSPRRLYNELKWDLEYYYLVILGHLEDYQSEIGENFGLNITEIMDYYKSEFQKIKDHQREKSKGEEPNYKMINRITKVVLEQIE